MHPSLFSNTEIQRFIFEYDPKNIDALYFGKPVFNEISNSEITAQIERRAHVQRKLPSWFEKSEVLYPPKENLAQSSSELTALKKTALLKGLMQELHISNECAADLTSGFGIDAHFMGEHFQRFDSVEVNGELLSLQQHNCNSYEIKNRSFHHSKAFDFLKQAYNVLYIDPSRRDAHRKQLIDLRQCEPNCIQHYDQLSALSDLFLIKASPMVDISQSLKMLPNCFRVDLITVHFELKEILFFNAKQKGSVEPEIHVHHFRKDSLQWSVFSLDKHKAEYQDITIKPLSNFLFEPHPGMMKAQCSAEISSRFKCAAVHHNTQLFTADEDRILFEGRRFKVIDHFSFSKRNMKAITGGHFHVVSKNFKRSVQEIRKQFKLKEGKDEYLFFTQEREPIVIRAIRIDRNQIEN